MFFIPRSKLITEHKLLSNNVEVWTKAPRERENLNPFNNPEILMISISGWIRTMIDFFAWKVFATGKLVEWLEGEI